MWRKTRRVEQPPYTTIITDNNGDIDMIITFDIPVFYHSKIKIAKGIEDLSRGMIKTCDYRKAIQKNVEEMEVIRKMDATSIVSTEGAFEYKLKDLPIIRCPGIIQGKRYIELKLKRVDSHLLNDEQVIYLREAMPKLKKMIAQERNHMDYLKVENLMTHLNSELEKEIISRTVVEFILKTITVISGTITIANWVMDLFKGIP